MHALPGLVHNCLVLAQEQVQPLAYAQQGSLHMDCMVEELELYT